MTMSGLQRSHKLQGGKQFLNLAILMLVICLTLLSCTDHILSVIPGPGRADWEVQLSAQYYIIRANSSSKKICKATDTPGLYENVLSNFYVTKYSLLDTFISLEGIPTDGIFASDEELASSIRQYYLLDIQDGGLYGPYETADSMMESDLTKDINGSLVWETVPQ